MVFLFLVFLPHRWSRKTLNCRIHPGIAEFTAPGFSLLPILRLIYTIAVFLSTHFFFLLIFQFLPGVIPFLVVNLALSEVTDIASYNSCIKSRCKKKKSSVSDSFV